MTKPLKAYEVRDPEEGNCVIVFATNSATARREGASELNTEFECVESCTRAPWADAFAPGPVPLHAALEAGWWHECGHCGCRFSNEGRHGEDDDERDDACEPAQRGAQNYCSETCAQEEWAARQARKAREHAVTEAAAIRFPGVAVHKAYETTHHSQGSRWCAAFTVPGLQYAVHWTLGAKTVDVSQCDVDKFEAWQQKQKRF